MAAQVIKGYSPELMVSPIYDTSSLEPESLEKAIRAKSGSLHCMVVGPGLGRDKRMTECLKLVMSKNHEADLPVVVDADGLFHIAQDLSIAKGHPRNTLTPNVMEFMRLWTAAGFDEADLKQDGQLKPSIEQVSKLAEALGHVTILMKGPTDLISDGHNSMQCSVAGGLKRCGGLGKPIHYPTQSSASTFASPLTPCRCHDLGSQVTC